MNLPSPSRGSAAAIGLVLVAVLVTSLLHWPLPLHLEGSEVHAHFHGSHVWCFDHMAGMITGTADWSHRTREIGFPETVQLRFIAWVPALLALPFRPFVGPVGAYNLVLLLSPAASALATWLFLQRVVGKRPWVCAGAALSFVLGPYALGCMANGQMAKIQLWIIPLCLWAVSKAIRGPRAWVGLVLAPVFALAGALTSPSTTLFLPLALLLFVPWELARSPSKRALGMAALALVLTALALLPARSYYGGLRSTSSIQAFSPGRPPPAGEILEPSIVAQPEETFLTQARRDAHPSQSHHVTYLGLPVLLFCLVLCRRRFEGRGAALTLLVGGTLLSMGPHLASGGALVEWGGHTLPLPAMALEALGYPTADSGMYYRAIQLAALGIAILIAGGSGTGPKAIALAWLLGLGQVYDGWRVTDMLWPRDVAPLEGADLLAEMAADPTPGAVLDLPLEAEPYVGGRHMLAAVAHGRATNALPRQNRIAHLPHLARLDRSLRGDPDGLESRLSALGFRYVIWHRTQDPDPETGTRLEAALGPGRSSDDVVVWSVDP